MRHSTIGLIFRVASVLLIALVITMWAVPFNWAAHLSFLQKRLAGNSAVHSNVIRLRHNEDHGLLVKTWINGKGTYTFALDTGAGAIILSKRVAQEAKVTATGRSINLSGLSGISKSRAQQATISSIAIGNKSNLIQQSNAVLITEHLPEDLDGILDPAELYKEIGFIIDIPNATLSTFDPYKNPIRLADAPADGAVVQWLDDRDSSLPLVSLSNRHRALIDTGSRLGLGLNIDVARSFGIKPTDIVEDDDHALDVGGGQVRIRKVRPITVNIGQMVLRNVPTNLILDASSNAPIILGRELLQPFQLSFDPVNRLIKLDPQ
jgi:predicted aspartyl protease